MQAMARWIDRRFDYIPPAGEYPVIVERLRGTPSRVAERIRFVPATVLTRRSGEGWTIQEQIGHLLDIEALWSLRVDEFLRGAKELTAADMTNRRTHEAGHNERSIHSLVAEFTVARGQMVARLAAATNPEITSFHPRLQRPMRLIDFCFFMAEHDDHHLAIVTRLLTASPA
jgi:uncharacterized damage-inducible protein DinB